MCECNSCQHLGFIVLLTVNRYSVFGFIAVDKIKSAKNIWDPVIENNIILGFLMADPSLKQ